MTGEPVTLPGRVFWITGLSGSGKTTIAQELYRRIRETTACVVVLDGDQLREIFPQHAGYSREERLRLALSYGRLCKALADQGIHVICATISLFAECHRWNRVNIKNYYEIYLRAPLDVLRERDPKGLYKKALQGEITSVVGVDMPFDEPQDPSIVLDTDGTQSPSGLVDVLVRELQLDA